MQGYSCTSLAHPALNEKKIPTSYAINLNYIFLCYSMFYIERSFKNNKIKIQICCSIKNNPEYHYF